MTCEQKRERSIDLIPLMGPPGAGKSTLGNALNQHEIASYVELEPILVERFGQGEDFAKHRAQVHEWIWGFIREQVETRSLAVVMETTGISGRDFLREMQRSYRLLFVNVNTPKRICIERVQTRAQGQHVTDHGKDAAGEFYDYWHADVKPTYEFGLTVSGCDLESDIRSIAQAVRF